MENLESEDDQYKDNLLGQEVPEFYTCFPPSKCSIPRWLIASPHSSLGSKAKVFFDYVI